MKVDHDLAPIESKSFDLKQFELLYNSTNHLLQKYAVYYVNDLEVAKSIVNDLFVQLWFKNIAPLNIKSYLYRSVKNACLNYLEQQHKNLLFYVEQDELTALADLTIEPQKDHSETDHHKFLQQVITLLPQKRQLVFRMHRLEGFTYAEIADLLQISPRTVEDHLSKAMQFIHAQATQFLYTNLTEA